MSESPSPASALQAEALAGRSLPPAEKLRDGVWSLTIPFAGAMRHNPTNNYTLTYAIEGSDGSICLIDPGWETAENLANLDGQLRSIGHSLENVTFAAVTHLHIDHVSASNSVRAASGARVGMHPVERAAITSRTGLSAAAAVERDDARFTDWGVPADIIPSLSATWSKRAFPNVEADVLLADGDALPIPGRDIRVVHTPGHTSGHLCFADVENGLLFSGDHVLPRIYPGVGLGGDSAANPVRDFVSSLERVTRDFAAYEVCPGHEYRFFGLGDRCSDMIEHRRIRSDGVAAALDYLRHPTLWQVASEQKWSAGWSGLSGYNLASALIQTAFHVDALGRTAELRRSHDGDH